MKYEMANKFINSLCFQTIKKTVSTIENSLFPTFTSHSLRPLASMNSSVEWERSIQSHPMVLNATLERNIKLNRKSKIDLATLSKHDKIWFGITLLRELHDGNITQNQL